MIAQEQLSYKNILKKKTNSINALGNVKLSMDQARKTLLEALKTNNVSYAVAGAQINRNHAYLYQYIYKGSPRVLKDNDRLILEKFLNLPSGALVGTSEKSKVLQRESPVLPIAQNDAKLVLRVGKQAEIQSNVDLSRVIPKEKLFPSPKKDLPVYASAACGEGFTVVTSDPVEWIETPAQLINVAGAFAVYLTGESMYPRYEQGEILYIHPRPPKKGVDALIITSKKDNEIQAFVKRLVDIQGSKVILQQYNPPETIEMDLGIIVSMYTVIGPYRF